MPLQGRFQFLPGAGSPSRAGLFPVCLRWQSQGDGGPHTSWGPEGCREARCGQERTTGLLQLQG